MRNKDEGDINNTHIQTIHYTYPLVSIWKPPDLTRAKFEFLVLNGEDGFRIFVKLAGIKESLPLLKAVGMI